MKQRWLTFSALILVPPPLHRLTKVRRREMSQSWRYSVCVRNISMHPNKVSRRSPLQRAVPSYYSPSCWLPIATARSPQCWCVLVNVCRHCDGAAHQWSGHHWADERVRLWRWWRGALVECDEGWRRRKTLPSVRCVCVCVCVCVSAWVSECVCEWVSVCVCVWSIWTLTFL